MPSSRYNGVISNEINPPDVVTGRDASKLRRNKKQQKPGKENKQLKLSGNVDLGKNFKKQQRRKNGTRKATKPTITTTQHPNTISEDFPQNHHRHNHYDNRQQQPKIYRRPQPAPSTQPPETSTLRALLTQSTSTTVKSVEDSTLSEIGTRILEKVRKTYLVSLRVKWWKGLETVNNFKTVSKHFSKNLKIMLLKKIHTRKFWDYNVQFSSFHRLTLSQLRLNPFSLF